MWSSLREYFFLPMKNGLPNMDKNKMVILSLTRLCFLTARTKCSFATEAEIVVYWIKITLFLD